MKNILIALLLLTSAAVCCAVPTNHPPAATISVITTTNGVLTGASTNFFRTNASQAIADFNTYSSNKISTNLLSDYLPDWALIDPASFASGPTNFVDTTNGAKIRVGNGYYFLTGWTLTNILHTTTGEHFDMTNCTVIIAANLVGSAWALGMVNDNLVEVGIDTGPTTNIYSIQGNADYYRMFNGGIADQSGGYTIDTLTANVADISNLNISGDFDGDAVHPLVQLNHHTEAIAGTNQTLLVTISLTNTPVTAGTITVTVSGADTGSPPASTDITLADDDDEPAIATKIVAGIGSITGFNTYFVAVDNGDGTFTVSRNLHDYDDPTFSVGITNNISTGMADTIGAPNISGYPDGGIKFTGPRVQTVGDLIVEGKLTTLGAVDPPFVLYDALTRAEAKARILLDVPKAKQTGAAQFFNVDTLKMEIYRAAADKFYGWDGKELAAPAPGEIKLASARLRALKTSQQKQMLAAAMLRAKARADRLNALQSKRTVKPSKAKSK